MRVLLLGCGLQGRAVLHDLARSEQVTSVVCAEYDLAVAQEGVARFGRPGFEARQVNAAQAASLAALLAEGFDVVIDMLPRQFVAAVAEAAVTSGTHLVNTYYDHALRPWAEAAAERGVMLLPEIGMDPGIDLVLAAQLVRELGAVRALHSYGAGLPEPGADDNVLRYKISWNFEGVLSAYAREARVVRGGVAHTVPAREIFAPGQIERMDLPGIGELESYPNGDAVHYADLLGIRATATEVSRQAMRYAGHCAFWYAISQLGLLEDAPAEHWGGASPRAILQRHLQPQLQYAPGERDLIILRVVAESAQAPHRRITLQVIDYGDRASGLMAMNRTVGFPASIAAQMIGQGQVTGRGLLSPVRDIPFGAFVAELARRGILVERREEVLEGAGGAADAV